MNASERNADRRRLLAAVEKCDGAVAARQRLDPDFRRAFRLQPVPLLPKRVLIHRQHLVVGKQAHRERVHLLMSQPMSSGADNMHHSVMCV